MSTDQVRRMPVAVCETLPLVVEGLRSTLHSSQTFVLADSVQTLEEAARVLFTRSPRVLVLDKALGAAALMDWIGQIRHSTATPMVVWSSAMTEAEAVRFLKAGAKGILRKTASVASVLNCIETVASGGTWMEDSLFADMARCVPRPRSELTPREQQVLELVEQGLRNKEIARDLGIRPGTVKIHLKHIFEKTGVRGRYGLALSGMKDLTPVPTFHHA